MGELLDKIYLQSIWSSRHPNYISVNQEALKQIVEEMKKEFYDNVPLSDEAYEWFYKWLGGD